MSRARVRSGDKKVYIALLEELASPLPPGKPGLRELLRRVLTCVAWVSSLRDVTGERTMAKRLLVAACHRAKDADAAIVQAGYLRIAKPSPGDSLKRIHERLTYLCAAVDFRMSE